MKQGRGGRSRERNGVIATVLVFCSRIDSHKMRYVAWRRKGILMSMQFFRRLAVTSLVVGSFATLSDVVLAVDVAEIYYECMVPKVGKERCGDPNRNVRVGPLQRLTIQLDKISHKGACVTFYVKHAVSGNLLATSPKMCQPDAGGEQVWTNPQNEALDVYMNVSSDTVWNSLAIEGKFRLDKP